MHAVAANARRQRRWRFEGHDDLAMRQAADALDFRELDFMTPRSVRRALRADDDHHKRDGARAGLKLRS